MSRVHVRFDERGEVVEYELAPPPEQQRAEYERGFKALMLATSLEGCRALLRGETVPVDQLDSEQVARYGLKRR
jgi:hypothetical protein